MKETTKRIQNLLTELKTFNKVQNYKHKMANKGWLVHQEFHKLNETILKMYKLNRAEAEESKRFAKEKIKEMKKLVEKFGFKKEYDIDMTSLTDEEKTKYLLLSKTIEDALREANFFIRFYRDSM